MNLNIKHKKNAIDLTADSASIGRKFIVDISYMVHVVKLNVLMTWLIDDHKKYPKDDVVELMDNKNEKDKRLVD